MRRSTYRPILGVSAALLVATACSTSPKDIGIADPIDTTPRFAGADASDAMTTTDAARLCPSATCPASHTTCPDSRYACDVDLTRDRDNCGRCGNRCPTVPSTYYSDWRGPFGTGLPPIDFDCIDGACILPCLTAHGDCDGIGDNGCESYLGSNYNCGSCGVKCDSGKICHIGTCVDIEVGPACPPPGAICPDGCVDIQVDPNNCGECERRCERPDPMPPHTVASCNPPTDPKCKVECEDGWGDCNGNMADGCEVSLTTPNNDHCGACATKCSAPDTCRFDYHIAPRNGTGFPLSCNCGSQWVDCSSKAGDLECDDLLSDPQSCGGCGRQCPSGTACLLGRCGPITCPPGFADCNGDHLDGCEVDLLHDPKHCGSCATACDGTAGQPCVEGQCASEPCEGVR